MTNDDPTMLKAPPCYCSVCGTSMMRSKAVQRCRVCGELMQAPPPPEPFATRVSPLDVGAGLLVPGGGRL